MYTNRNTANVSSVDKGFVMEDDINRERGYIAENAHVPRENSKRYG